MGFSGVSFSQLVMIFLVALLVFGPQRLVSISEELAHAIKRFRQILQEKEEPRSDE